MKNVAIINSVYDRSTGKIASGLLSYLKSKGYKVFFCYGYGKEINNLNFYRINNKIEHYYHALMCRITGIEGAYSWFATKRLIKFLRKNKIDTIYGISLHGYYLNEKMFFDYLIREKIKFVYIMTDEYAFLGKCAYSNGCMNYLFGCGNCPQIKEYPKSLFFDSSAKVFKIKNHAYSQLRNTVFVGPEYTIIAAKKSPLINGIPTSIVDEAIDLNMYYPRETNELRKQMNINNQKIVILCVAPFNYERKGCKYFIEAAQRFENDKRFIFVHVGYTGDKTICPSNYIPIGYETDQNKLAEYYSLGDLFVFPSLLDTMPNACLESLACGTPLLCFNISGMPYIANQTTAIFVEPRNIDQLCDVINNTCKKTSETISVCRKYAESRYDNNKYYEKLTELGHLLGGKK